MSEEQATTVEQAIQYQAAEPVATNADALFEEYGDTVYRLALVRTRSVSDAEDVVQEVFLRYLRRRPEFENREHQKAWFLTVTVNCTKNLLTNAFRRRSVSLDAAFDAAEEDVYSDSTVLDAVLRLPEKYRTVTHLYYFESYSVREIASLMRASESAVKSWLHRARALLKEELRGEFSDV